jgi:acylphosphatase
MITQRLRIRGLVQGVGFRYALREQARRQGLSGWVRNRTDGTVEAVVQGPPERVNELTLWAQRGPPGSRVDDLQLEFLAEEPEHAGFELRPTV